jgi:hypothetical protein
MKKPSVDEVKQAWAWAVAAAHKVSDVTFAHAGEIREHSV